MDTSQLLYPYHNKFPLVIWSKFRWFINRHKRMYLPLINALGLHFTIIDGFGAPGDTLLTSIVVQNLKKKYKKIKFRLITRNPCLVKYDSNITHINAPETFFSEISWYLEIRSERNGQKNVLSETFNKLGINDFDYNLKIYLSEEEVCWAKNELPNRRAPKRIAFNCLSNQFVKNWPIDYWSTLIKSLPEFEWVQLGDHHEPELKNVIRCAGKYTMRESMALIGECDLFIGPDSFLGHAASGIGIVSIIIFGGSRTIKNLGYSKNINLGYLPPCHSCWIHKNEDGDCKNDVICMRQITVDQVKVNIINSFSKN